MLEKTLPLCGVMANILSLKSANLCLALHNVPFHIKFEVSRTKAANRGSACI